MIEMTEGGAGIYAFDEPADRIAVNVMNRGEDAIKYIVEEKDMTRPRFKMFRTCVGMAKDFLGIDNPFIITPNQLYNHITRGGRHG